MAWQLLLRRAAQFGRSRRLYEEKEKESEEPASAVKEQCENVATMVSSHIGISMGTHCTRLQARPVSLMMFPRHQYVLKE